MADPPLCAGFGAAQTDFDLSGLDVASTPATPDVSACCTACIDDCVGFTLFSGICYLKTAHPSGGVLD